MRILLLTLLISCADSRILTEQTAVSLVNSFIQHNEREIRDVIGEEAIVVPIHREHIRKRKEAVHVEGLIGQAHGTFAIFTISKSENEVTLVSCSSIIPAGELIAKLRKKLKHEEEGFPGYPYLPSEDAIILENLYPYDGGWFLSIDLDGKERWSIYLNENGEILPESGLVHY